MKNLTLDENTAKSLYPTAAPEFKTMLEETFGKQLFIKNVMDRVKTFEDACREVGVIPHKVYNPMADSKDEIAYKKLKIIAKALNEGWVVDWNNEKESKYFPYFDMRKRPGSGFVGSCFYWVTYSFVSSRLTYKTSTLAAYAGKQFEVEYYDYMVI